MLRDAADRYWREHKLVFPILLATQQDDAKVRRDFRRVIEPAGPTGKERPPRQLRHRLVSLLSNNGVPAEQTARPVGHSGTVVTELVYRKQIRPVLEDGVDRIFGTGDEVA
ncbi:MAG TPA: integrase [Actinophytocola sp.]|uniref:integrase n=1 Tax=Actinophytocola sp. TaxID=1872138 RepID=UPI002DDD5E1F|nr:integrase [Actinophytocola sp.]HEV2780656.1 integrase [Actinophytocola sp.]